MLKHILLSLGCLASALQASVEFPSNRLIETRVKFWEQIFARYGSHQTVVHDKDNLALILGILDPTAHGIDPLDTLAGERFNQLGLRNYEKILADFASLGQDARFKGPLAAAIWRIYGRDPLSTQRLLRGQVAIRTQGGLADTFQTAAAKAELYLPQMEQIFRQHSLPTDLTRLVFVESMFNLRARSKVGASGFWQLMPQTARSFIKVNHQVDERNSPLLATRAAARIMQENYRQLQTWPLAITAYNHGLGGTQRAVHRLGSQNLAVIIEDYQSPSFGFASRNFYAEFLAALRVHRGYQARLRKKNSAT